MGNVPDRVRLGRSYLSHSSLNGHNIGVHDSVREGTSEKFNKAGRLT
jgi:hypothetical protein